MNRDKQYCKPGESDAAFALAFAIAWMVITLVLGTIGILSLF
jgi:hypothetical protein